MAYKFYISGAESPDVAAYLATIKRALINLNEIPVTAADVVDMSATDQYMTEVKRLIDEADMFIGLYGATYGTVPRGETRSFTEQEYAYATTLGKSCLFYVPQAARDHADDRQHLFLQYVMQHHVVTFFKNTFDLDAQVKLGIGKYKLTRSLPRPHKLKPDGGMRFLPEREEAETVEESDDFEAQVHRAVNIAQDDIEQIVRRALELHTAQTQVQDREPTMGQYIEDERDGLVLARPLWGEPVRRSQFQSDIFMIMPFRERFNVLYNEVIHSVVSGLNLTMKRGDDFSSLEGSIIGEVWAAIYGCRLVIVETTEINANVYYELGIAHTLGKPAILLTQTSQVDQLPFDIRHLRFLVYEDTAEGYEQLTQSLHKSIVWILNDLKEQQEEG